MKDGWWEWITSLAICADAKCLSFGKAMSCAIGNSYRNQNGSSMCVLTFVCVACVANFNGHNRNVHLYFCLALWNCWAINVFSRLFHSEKWLGVISVKNVLYASIFTDITSCRCSEMQKNQRGYVAHTWICVLIESIINSLAEKNCLTSEWFLRDFWFACFPPVPAAF